LIEYINVDKSPGSSENNKCFVKLNDALLQYTIHKVLAI